MEQNQAALRWAAAPAQPSWPVVVLRGIHLGLLATQPGAATPRFRRLRYSAIFLGLSGVLAAWLLVAVDAAEATDVIALRILGYASWIYGAAGLSALLKTDEAPALALSSLRGTYTASDRTWAAGAGARIAAGTFLSSLPGLTLAFLVVANGPLWQRRLSLLPLAFLYCLGLGASLGAVAALARRFWPRAPRMAAAALILGPYLLSLAWPQLPSLPGFFARLINDMIVMGGDPLL